MVAAVCWHLAVPGLWKVRGGARLADRLTDRDAVQKSHQGKQCLPLWRWPVSEPETQLASYFVCAERTKDHGDPAWAPDVCL